MNLIEVKKLLAKQAKRPILQALHYEGEYITICDAYSIVREKLISKVNDIMNIDINSGHLSIGTYPNIDNIIPKDHQPVTSMTFSITPDGEYYIINEIHKFNKKQVDQTFKCIDIKDILKLSLDNFKLNMNGLQLVYEVNRYYVLILGVES